MARSRYCPGVGWVQRNRTFLVLLGVAVAIGGALFANQASNQAHFSDQARSLRTALVLSCERTNVLRAESNARIGDHEADRQALVLVAQASTLFSRAAEAARARSVSAADRQTAHVYARALSLYEQARTLERGVRFDSVPIVDCNRVVPAV